MVIVEVSNVIPSTTCKMSITVCKRGKQPSELHTKNFSRPKMVFSMSELRELNML